MDGAGLPVLGCTEAPDGHPTPLSRPHPLPLSAALLHCRAAQESTVQVGLHIRRGIGGTCPAKAAARRPALLGILQSLLGPCPTALAPCPARDSWEFLLGTDCTSDQTAASFRATANCTGLAPATFQGPCPPAPTSQQGPRSEPGPSFAMPTASAHTLGPSQTAPACGPMPRTSSPVTSHGPCLPALASAQQPCPPASASAQGQEQGPLASAQSPRPPALVTAPGLTSEPEPCSPVGEEEEEQEDTELRCVTDSWLESTVPSQVPYWLLHINAATLGGISYQCNAIFTSMLSLFPLTCEYSRRS